MAKSLFSRSQRGQFVAEPLEGRRLLAAQLVGDLDPRTYGSDTSAYTNLNGTALFYANSKLYRTDGTTTGTTAFATVESSVDTMAVIGTYAYFARNNTITRTSQLWKTDGTAGGTTAVCTLPVGPYYFPGGLQAANGRLYFKVDSLYSVDIASTNVQALGAGIRESAVTEYNGAVYFGSNGSLYRTDGTAAGTSVVKQINTSGIAPTNLTVVNGLLYFNGYSYPTGTEPWRSDGSASGTNLLYDLGGGSISSDPSAYIAVGSKTLVVTSSGLLVSTATTVNVLSTAIHSVTTATDAVSLGAMAVFVANTSAGGTHAYRSDGTSAGTFSLETFGSTNGSDARAIGILGGQAYFGATVSGVSNLYRTNGTVAGTVVVTQAVAGSLPYAPTRLVTIGSRLYFDNDDTIHGSEPFVSDGTASGTRLLGDLNVKPFSSDPGGPYPGTNFQAFDLGDNKTATLGNVTFFGTVDGSLWKSDGTAASTIRVTKQYGLYGSRRIRHLTAWNGKVYFLVESSDWSVWRSDGTAAGTVRVMSATSDTARGNPFVPFKNALYYLSGGGLYAITDTSVTTVASDLVYTGQLTATTNALYFYSGYQSRLWKSDGTAGGTSAFAAAASLSSLTEFVSIGDTLYFQATPAGAYGGNLCRTDGTAAGTAVINTTFLSGWNNSNSVPNYITAMNGVVYFVGSDGVNASSFGLWRSDGTVAGTMLVAAGGQPQFLTVIGNRLYYLNTTAETGDEPYVSDGTAVGTHRVADINAGPASSLKPFPPGYKEADNPFMPAPDGSVLVTADDGTHGVELYRITPAGNVVLAADVYPGTTGSGAQPISIVTPPGSTTPTLLFSAADPMYGRELWSLPLTPDAGLPGWISAASDAAYVFSGVALQVTAGTVTLLADAAASGAAFAISVSGTGRVVFNTSQHLGTLALTGLAMASVNASGKVLRLTSLAVGSSTRLDLNDNVLLYDYSGTTPQANFIAAQIATARAGGAWTGPGLTSTAAKNKIGQTTTLGYMEASEYKAIYGAAATFAGETIDSTAVLVRYTLYGDADLNRTVDFNDFLKLQNGFGQSNTTFAGGNFNYDAATDFNDFLMLQNNFGQSLPVPRDGGTVATPVKTPPPAPPQTKTASLSGTAFNDANRNGKYDKGDSLAAGKTVWLDLDNDGVKDANEPSAVTDAQGKYAFKNLAAGKYRVRRVFPGGYVESTAARYVTLAAGQAATGVVVGSRVR